MMFVFLPAVAVFWLRALRTSSWRWWIALAAAEFALLYTYPAMLYPLVAFNAAALLLLLLRHPLRVSPSVPLARWLVVSAVSGMAFFWLFLPCVPQMQAYLDSGDFRIPMGWPWVRDFGSHLFAGVLWFRSGELGSPFPELYQMSYAKPGLFAILLGSALLLATLGAMRCLWRGWLSASLVVILTLPAVIKFYAAYRSGFYLLEWYLIYVLLAWVLLIATGADTLSLAWRNRRFGAAVPAVVVACFLAGYLVFVHSAHAALLSRGIQPLREIAIAARGTILPNYPGHEKVVTLGAPLRPYDPHFRHTESLEEFLQAVLSADAMGKEVYVHQVTQPEMDGSDRSKIALLCAQPRYFEKVVELPAFERMLGRVLLRYRTGSLESALPTEEDWQSMLKE
jgi:hypothetical protein